jgi:hypothetical protein
MKLPEFLKRQLLDFVDTYRKYYSKTFSITLLLAIVCFLAGAELLRFSSYYAAAIKPTDIITALFHRYSERGVYSVADLTKIVFVFFISLFTVPFYKVGRRDACSGSFSTRQLFKNLEAGDLGYMVFTLVVSIVVDYLLFALDSYFLKGGLGVNLSVYLHNLVFHLRVYVPLMLFAIASGARLGIFTAYRGQNILFLYISLWLFNEFAYEIWLWLRSRLFGLLLFPFSNSDSSALFSNMLGMPLMAFYFLGYSSAMILPLTIKVGRRDEANDGADEEMDLRTDI